MEISKISSFSGKEHTLEIDITEEEYAKWLNSFTPIQVAFLKLSADEREFLMTGITPSEWNILFNIGEDEDIDPDDPDCGLSF